MGEDFLRILHHQMAIGEEHLHPIGQGQKGVATKRVRIPGQTRQLSRREKPWMPSKRRAEIASQVGKVLRTEHHLRAKQGAS